MKTTKSLKSNLVQRTFGMVALSMLAAPILHASLASLQTSDSQLNTSQSLVQQSVLQLLGDSSGSQQNLSSLSSSQSSYMQGCLGQMIGMQNLAQLNLAQQNLMPIYVQTGPLQQQVLQLLGQPNSVVQQSGISQLSQANQSQQSVLQLFNGSDSAQNNSAADNAAQLSQAQSSLSSVAQQNALSTGLKINSAADNAAGQLQQFLQQTLTGNMNNTKCMIVEVDPNKLIQSSTLAQANTSLQTLQQASQNDLSTGLQIAQNNGDDSSLSQSINQLSTGLKINSGQSLSGNQTWLNQGGKLDFFVIANGLSQAGGLSLQTSLNQDCFQQEVTSLKQLNSPYIFVAFENMWGCGDANINTGLGGINVGNVIVCAILATPEPTMPMTFAAFLGVALLAVRKSKKATTVA